AFGARRSGNAVAADVPGIDGEPARTGRCCGDRTGEDDGDGGVNISGAKILVTGGCGLIGSTTIDQLLPEDVGPIVIYDNLVRGSMHNVAEILNDKRVTLVKGDIRDVEATRNVTEGMDAVIHMAAIRITACAENPREALEVMCDGTFNVVEAAHLAGVKKI